MRKTGNYLVAFRFLESSCRELNAIGTAEAIRILEKLKEPKRDLEDIIW